MAPVEPPWAPTELHREPATYTVLYRLGRDIGWTRALVNATPAQAEAVARALRASGYETTVRPTAAE